MSNVERNYSQRYAETEITVRNPVISSVVSSFIYSYSRKTSVDAVSAPIITQKAIISPLEPPY